LCVGMGLSGSPTPDHPTPMLPQTSLVVGWVPLNPSGLWAKWLGGMCGVCCGTTPPPPPPTELISVPPAPASAQCQTSFQGISTTQRPNRPLPPTLGGGGRVMLACHISANHSVDKMTGTRSTSKGFIHLFRSSHIQRNDSHPTRIVLLHSKDIPTLL
jgi:hypothetical protein